jgi:lipoprotein signal peptidase
MISKSFTISKSSSSSYSSARSSLAFFAIQNFYDSFFKGFSVDKCSFSKQSYTSQTHRNIVEPCSRRKGIL